MIFICWHDHIVSLHKTIFYLSWASRPLIGLDNIHAITLALSVLFPTIVTMSKLRDLVLSAQCQFQILTWDEMFSQHMPFWALGKCLFILLREAYWADIGVHGSVRPTHLCFCIKLKEVLFVCHQRGTALFNMFSTTTHSLLFFDCNSFVFVFF